MGKKELLVCREREDGEDEGKRREK